MEYVIMVLGFCLLIIGIIGCVLPALPGLLFCWGGLLCYYFLPNNTIDYWLLGITLFFCILVSVADYVIPSKSTKKFGGTSHGVWGTNIGLVVGLFMPVPFGFVIGAFVGAFIGEMINNSRDKNKAFKAAFGSFLGFLAGTFMKLFYAFILLGIYTYKIIGYYL
jgi:uncharacterized protein